MNRIYVQWATIIDPVYKAFGFFGNEFHISNARILIKNEALSSQPILQWMPMFLSQKKKQVHE